MTEEDNNGWPPPWFTCMKCGGHKYESYYRHNKGYPPTHYYRCKDCGYEITEGWYNIARDSHCVMNTAS